MSINNISISPKVNLGDFTNLDQKAKQLGSLSNVDISKMSEKEKNTLKEKCADFESIFLKMMLSTMRKSGQAIKTSLEGVNKQQSDFYYDLLDTEYAKSMSHSRGGLGIGDMIYRQLTEPVISAKDVARKYTNL